MLASAISLGTVKSQLASLAGVWLKLHSKKIEQLESTGAYHCPFSTSYNTI